MNSNDAVSGAGKEATDMTQQQAHENGTDASPSFPGKNG